MTEPLNSCSLGAMGSLLRKLDKLLRHDKMAEGLIGDLRILQTKMEELSKLHRPPHTVKYWMSEARELSYDMEVCVDRFDLAVLQHLPAQLPQIFPWHKQILGFAARVKEANERSERYNLVPSSPTKIIASHQHQTLYEEPDPVEMNELTNKLIDWLMLKDHGEDEDKLNVVAILGDGGVGKSTLVKRLWRVSDDNKFQFDCRAFVQTAKIPDTRMILRSILSQVHPQAPTKCSSKVLNLIQDLTEHLQYKRYFIVIEDLWDISVWNIVRRAFPEKKCRIIATTIVENVAQSICNYDRNNIVNVCRLNDGEAKKFFINRAFGSRKTYSSQFNDVTDKITRKCGGLPLAIICTAGLVAKQPDTEQGQQLNYVNNSLPMNLRAQSSSTEILTEVLNLCYSWLPCSARTCLLYLSMYPENYLFMKEDLVKQWMAEDFICAPDGNDIADVAGSYFDELVSLGLVQQMDTIKSNKKALLSYTVHPAVFDFIVCKSMEDNFITTIDYSQSTAVLTEKVRRLSLHFGSATYATTPACVELSQVLSLSFIGLLGCMPSIAEFMLVRVVILHIWSDDGDTKLSLAEICKLLQLKYLQVRCNVTVNLPNEMQCLKYLETVEINAGVEYASSDMVHVSTLRHLRLGDRTKPSPGQIASAKACSSVDWSYRLPSAPILLESFELMHPICVFSRLPQWFRQLCKLRILEIVVRQVLPNDIDAVAELQALKHLSLYVRTPPSAAIIFRSGMFPALEYFKLVCGVLSLAFMEKTLPNLQRLKLVFNAHKRKYSNDMVSGISHLLGLQKVVGSIGLVRDAEESDWVTAECAFKDAIRQHPHHRSFKDVKRVDPVDGYWPVYQIPPQPSISIRSFAEQAKCVNPVDEEGPSKKLRRSIKERGWKLAFRSPPKLPIFTGSNIEDVSGSPLEVILVDLEDGSMSKLADTLSIELVPLAGDFFPKSDDRKYWTADEFERAVVWKRQGKRRPLLSGDVKLTMRDGHATVGKLQFTDNSSWVSSGMFRIGVRVEPGSYNGARILEAITEKPIVVKDNSTRRRVKHYPPSIDDEVWRLDNIAKTGAFRTKLGHYNIKTVGQFLRMLMVKPDYLREILGMTDSQWVKTTTHAKTCSPGEAVYVYRASDGVTTIYVNSVFDLLKVDIGESTYQLHELNHDQKTLARRLMVKAYETYKLTTHGHYTGDNILLLNIEDSVHPLLTFSPIIDPGPSINPALHKTPAMEPGRFVKHEDL